MKPSPTVKLKTHLRRRQLLSLAGCLLMAAAAPMTTHAQLPPNTLFYDDFEHEPSVCPYPLSNFLASNFVFNAYPGSGAPTHTVTPTPGSPNPYGIVGGWITWDAADGGGGTFGDGFGVQVTSAVDPTYTGHYEGSNALQVFRAIVGPGSAVSAQFSHTQTGGKVRMSWLMMIHPSFGGANTHEGTLLWDSLPGMNGNETGISPFIVMGFGTDGTASGTGGVNFEINTWFTNQIDIDLDHQTYSYTIYTATGTTNSGSLGFNDGASPTISAFTTRGASSLSDLYYFDSILVYPIVQPILVTTTPGAGQPIETTAPLVYNLANGFAGGTGTGFTTNLTSVTNLNVDTNTIQLFVNGTQVTPIISGTSNNTTVSYIPPLGWTALSSNFLQLVYTDTETPPVTTTNNLGLNVLQALSTVPPRDQDSSAFGLVTIEAEDYDRIIGSVSTSLLDPMSWQLVTSPSDYSGTGAMQALPLTFSDGTTPMNANLITAAAVQNSPRMDYKIRLLHSGTTWVWLRACASSSTYKAINVGLDGTWLNTFNAPVSNDFVWVRSPAITATAGYHFLTIWMGNNGFILDKIVVTSSSVYNPSTLPANLPVETSPSAASSYWRFEEAGGPALDINGYPSFPGTFEGAAVRTNSVFGTPIPLTGAANAQSVVFDGANGSAVDMGANGTLNGGTNLDVGTGTCTLEAWINASAAGFGHIAGKLFSGDFGDTGYTLDTRPSGAGYTVEFDVRHSGGAIPSALSGVLNLGQWYHVAGTRDGTNVNLYVNGALVASVADTTAGTYFTGPQHFSVGGGLQDSPQAYETVFNGLIDEVRLTLTNLPASQFLNAGAVTEPLQTTQLPANGSFNVPDNTNITLTITNGTLDVNTSTIQLLLNGTSVSPTVTSNNNLITVTYQPPTALQDGSLVTYEIIFSDNGSPVFTQTNSYSYTVAYVPISTPHYWRFEEASGDVAVDEYGLWPGILTGDATRTTDVPVSVIPQTGAANTQSMSFDGVGATGVVTGGVDMGSGIQVNANDFTMECWVKVTGDPNGAGLICGKMDTGIFSDQDFALICGGQTSGQVPFQFYMTGGNSVSTGLKNENQWYHLAGVRHGNTISIYVDGVLQSSASLNTFTNFTSEQHFSVGEGISGGITTLLGEVDEVRISPNALPPSLFLNAPPAPIINAGLSLSAHQLTLSWLVTGYVLQQNTNLDNTNGWSNVAGGSTSPVVVNTGSAPGGVFYRLIQAP